MLRFVSSLPRARVLRRASLARASLRLPRLTLRARFCSASNDTAVVADTWKWSVWPPPSNEEIIAFFEWASKRLGLQSRYQWHNVDLAKFYEVGGGPLLQLYFSNSLYLALKDLYPDDHWYPWLFGYVDEGYWDNSANQRLFFNWIGTELSLNDWKDWYSVSRADVVRIGGASLLVSHFHNSLGTALTTVYTEHPWQGWRFVSPPHDFWNHTSNIKAWYISATKDLAFQTPTAWYKATKAQVASVGGASLLRKFEGDLCSILALADPIFSWRPWLFDLRKENLWDNESLWPIFFSDLTKKLGVHTKEQMYSIRPQHFSDNGAQGLIQKFDNNVSKFVRYLYPDHPWMDWRFVEGNVHGDSWAARETRLAFLEWAFTELKLDSTKGLDAWYGILFNYREPPADHVLTSQIKKIGGASLLKVYGHSLDRLLVATYPEHKWLPWRFRKAVHGFWELFENQKMYFDWLGTRLNFTKPDDWYKITKELIVANYGGSLLVHYFNNSPSKFVKKMMPEHDWIEWKFTSVSAGFWSSHSNRRAYFDWLFKELKLTDMDGWYSVKKEDISSNRGGGLLTHRYNNNVSLALADVYPDHEWHSWKVGKLPPLYWTIVAEDGSKIKVSAAAFIEDAAKRMQLRGLEDWYRVSRPQLSQAGIWGITTIFGGLPALLQKIYPQHAWDTSKFELINKRSQQRHLLSSIRSLFPNETLLEEFTVVSRAALGRASSAHQPDSAQLDVLLPNLHIAFEYQGQHHFFDVGGTGVAERKATTDPGKAALCLKEGITLIAVPFWWDGSLSSLANEIRKVRPDLIAQPMGDGQGIPESPPSLKP